MTNSTQKTTNKTTPQVDGYLRKNKTWQTELEQLRKIILDSPLIEEVKWRVPCYTFQDANVVILGTFKESCVLSFVKGALLQDPAGILVKPGENTQSARVIRFTNTQQITKLKPLLKTYILEAIEIEKSGLKVQFKTSDQFTLPEELETKFKQLPALKTAFRALTPGRQRAYLLQFTSAKQSKTRTARIEKVIPKILAGKGPDDA